MNAGKAIYGRLSTVDAVSALVGNRIEPLESGQAREYPRIAYDPDDAERPGGYTSGSGITFTDVSVYCVARTYAGAVALATAVRDAMDRQTGTWGGVVVQGCFFQNCNEDRGDPGTGTDNSAFSHELIFRIVTAD
jgi:hypothetical protein